MAAHKQNCASGSSTYVQHWFQPVYEVVSSSTTVPAGPHYWNIIEAHAGALGNDPQKSANQPSSYRMKEALEE